MNKWDLRLLSLAQHVSSWSKDPSTRVGAVIADTHHRILGIGYNGFPRGVADGAARYADRELKYQLVVHAELNAILNATRSVEGCTLYAWPVPVCAECAKAIIQSGISHVVTIRQERTQRTSKYAAPTESMAVMFSEAGISWETYPEDALG